VRALPTLETHERAYIADVGRLVRPVTLVNPIVGVATVPVLTLIVLPVPVMLVAVPELATFPAEIVASGFPTNETNPVLVVELVAALVVAVVAAVPVVAVPCVCGVNRRATLPLTPRRGKIPFPFPTPNGVPTWSLAFANFGLAARLTALAPDGTGVFVV
jgi:hypothetical protein